MSMPNELVFVRHGESEANVANHADKEGDSSLKSDERFKARHDSDMRLTPRGAEQAQITGEWIKENIGEFDRYFYSPYRRTEETMSNLALRPAIGWMENDLIRERDWGEFGNMTEEEREAHLPFSKQNKDLNPWYWTPSGGESLATGTRLRFERFLLTMHNEMEKKRVIAVSHGEYMWVARFVLERMTVSQWIESDADKSQRIQNAMVLQYTRRDPERPSLIADSARWARAVCPWDESKSINGGDWWEIERRTHTEDEIMEKVKSYPRLFSEE